VLKAHSSIVRQFRTNVLHRPEFSPSDNVDVDPTGPGAVRSRPYKLGRKRRLAPPVRLLFQDGTNKRSPELRVTGPVEVESVETGAFSIGPIEGITFKLPTVHFRAPSEDPSLFLSVLAPWMGEADVYGLTFAEYIHNIAVDQASEADVDVATVESDLESYLRDYLPGDSRGWQVAFERNELVVEPGSSGTAVLRVVAETPGQAVFAVVATPDGNPEEAAVSDLYVLEVRERGVFEIRDSL
jgi:hypothetical protein